MVGQRTAVACALALAAAHLETPEAHSWIDCIDTDRTVVYDNARAWIYGGETANGRCKGYIDNYPGRGDSRINDKMTHKVLMRDVLAGAAPCPTYTSMTGGDAKGFHHIKVSAGERFYYGYLDNGHTSKDKAGRGTFYGVYWTGESGTRLKSTTDLTDDRLIDGALHDFDDKNCGQTWEDGDFTGTIPSGRAGNEYPCVGETMIPAGTKPGIYNLIWFWRFYNDKINSDVTTTGGHYGGAAYSSCFQVEVVGSGAGGVESDADATSSQPPATAAYPAPTPAPSTETLVPTPSTSIETETVAPTPAPAPTTATTVSPTLAPTSVPVVNSPTPAINGTPAPVTGTVTNKKDCGVQKQQQTQQSQRHLRT